ncbi:MAG: pyrroline-5-carboxylate reductase [Burkholderiales bacterium]|nr:pyrroline-5-carboxylate reductase [Burkholderiales bacterium]MDQ3195251.1 pyrroline-5-carboxylate reductase [Pseudomonadota bacterium]
MNITFVGGGNMAGALIGGLLKHGYRPDQIKVAELDRGACDALFARFAVSTHTEIAPAIEGSDCIVLAVKPQQLGKAAADLAPLLKNQLVISIAAGVRCRDLARWLQGHQRLVRVMPNTPALIAAGVSALYAMPEVDADQRSLAAQIFDAVGMTIWLESEEQLDAITALSGSGPAYVFYFVEALQQAALELGFAPQTARKLSLATFDGAIRLAAQSSDAVDVLRARVTSKGGTTERALSVMQEAEVKQHIVRAIHEAAQRSAELGDELGQEPRDAAVDGRGKASGHA